MISDDKIHDRNLRTGLKKTSSMNVILTGFDWQDAMNDPDQKMIYEPRSSARYCFADFRDKVKILRENNVNCNSGIELHSMFGCLHSCSYCHIDNYLTVMLDVEKFAKSIKRLLKRHRSQKLWKYDNQGDILTLEPEYGATEMLVRLFSKTDQSLMLYTKSDNVGVLEGLKHKGRTIVCWTISCDEVAERYEIGAPSLDSRLEAARKCRDWGYRVRFRFSPIIPVHDWKEKNLEMIEKVYSVMRPGEIDVISLETLCHMNASQCAALFADLEFRPQEAAPEYELFAHGARRSMYSAFIDEIRKHDKDVKLALCLETDKMWDGLKGRLGQEPKNFYCCCGAKCG